MHLPRKNFMSASDIENRDYVFLYEDPSRHNFALRWRKRNDVKREKKKETKLIPA